MSFAQVWGKSAKFSIRSVTQPCIYIIYREDISKHRMYIFIKYLYNIKCLLRQTS